MTELTEKQKLEAKQVIDTLMDYLWNKIELKMQAGMSFEIALQELHEEILND